MQSLGLCLSFHLCPMPWDGMRQNDSLLSSLLVTVLVSTVMANPTPPWLVTGPRNRARFRGQVSHSPLPNPPDSVDLQGHSASERQSPDSTHSLYIISFCLPG